MSAAATVSNEAPVTWDEMAASSQWLALTPRQRVWVVGFLATNDEVWATKMSYEGNNPEVLRTKRYEVRRNPAVRCAIGFFRGNERETLLDEVRESIRKSEPGSVAQVRALSLYARLAGFVAPEGGEAEKPAEKVAENPVHKFRVDETFTQKGIRYRVTAVDANGRILDAEEIE